MDITTIFGALTIIVGGVCIMLIVGTKTLRDSRDDFAIRIKQLEDERVLDKANIGSLETAVRFWRSAATGDEKLDAISALLNEHHGEARQNWVLVNAALSHVGRSIDHMNESLDQLVVTLGGGTG